MAEFQYNDKKHMAIRYIPFKLNFGRHLWKENLTVKIELPKLEDFLEGLWKSWKTTNKSIKNNKRSYKETIWQKKKKSTKTEKRKQCVAESQEYPFKLTLKEAELEKI